MIERGQFATTFAWPGQSGNPYTLANRMMFRSKKKLTCSSLVLSIQPCAVLQCFLAWEGGEGWGSDVGAVFMNYPPDESHSEQGNLLHANCMVSVNICIYFLYWSDQFDFKTRIFISPACTLHWGEVQRQVDLYQCNGSSGAVHIPWVSRLRDTALDKRR